MTASLTLARVRDRAARRPAVEATLLVAGLGGITLARLDATRAGLDALAVGAAFGAALVALAMAGGSEPRVAPRAARSILVGIGFGHLIVAVTLAGARLSGGVLIAGLGRPEAPLVPWALVTILVALGEEAILRGALFDRFRQLGGPLSAVLATSLVFAVMHAPLYGWHVVPLDLAVGLGLGGLRLVTRGIAAPAAAHAVADLATWLL